MQKLRRLTQRNWLRPGLKSIKSIIVGAFVFVVAGVAVAQGIVARIEGGLLNGGGGQRTSTNFVVEDGLQFSGLIAGAPEVFSLSGMVTEGPTPVGGVVIYDGTGRSTTTTADGRYFLNNLPRGSYVLTAVKTGYTFDQNGRTVNLLNSAEEDFNATAQDAFEADNTCAQAKAIDQDGTVQAHTFHQASDEDWVQFDAAAGTRYQFEGNIPIASKADLAIELYADCALGTLGGQDVTFSPGVRFEYTPTTDAPLYLKMTNSAPQFVGAQAAYEISVRSAPAALSGNDVAILVAGKVKDNDPLQPNIRNMTSKFYDFLVSHGYDADRVQYLADDLSVSNSDALATRANLRDAITVWAQARLAANAMLTVYLMDHGDPELFYLDKNKDELLLPSDLDAWLTQIENSVPNLKVNIFIEACYSGSFVDLPAPNSISKPNRVVIASAGDGQLARASASGATFSDQFIPALFQGISFYNSFQIARWATQGTHGDAQLPWLDDDGDGNPNEPEDGKVAQKRGFGFAGNIADSFAPFVVEVTHTLDAASKQVAVSALITDNTGLSRAWATIYPPNYNAGGASSELLPDTALTVTLAATGPMSFGASLGAFNRLGLYRVVVNAEDLNGLRAQPVAFDVRTGWGTYLPLVRR